MWRRRKWMETEMRKTKVSIRVIIRILGFSPLDEEEVGFWVL